MSEITTTEQYVYKIYSDKVEILEEYIKSPLRIAVPLPTTELDQKDGYIHLSFFHQVQHVVNTFFKEFEKVAVFKIKVDNLKESLKLEDVKLADGIQQFPHFYSTLYYHNVETLTWVGRGKDGQFDLSVIDRS